jgi:hypothetical protein
MTIDPNLLITAINKLPPAEAAKFVNLVYEGNGVLSHSAAASTPRRPYVPRQVTTRVLPPDLNPASIKLTPSQLSLEISAKCQGILIRRQCVVAAFKANSSPTGLTIGEIVDYLRSINFPVDDSYYGVKLDGHTPRIWDSVRADMEYFLGHKWVEKTGTNRFRWLS